jgi:hypothetical protein
MANARSRSASPPVYRNKPLTPHVKDSYKPRVKYTEPTACPECNAVYHAGHWQWLELPASPAWELCPACQRIRDDMPAGHVKLEGRFLDAHRPEIRSLVNNVGDKEKGLRPLNRIIDMVDTDEGALLVRTTDAHLARAIGEAVHHAYQGELKVQQAPDENLARVHWQR